MNAARPVGWASPKLRYALSSADGRAALQGEPQLSPARRRELGTIPGHGSPKRIASPAGHSTHTSLATAAAQPAKSPRPRRGDAARADFTAHNVGHVGTMRGVHALQASPHGPEARTTAPRPTTVTPSRGSLVPILPPQSPQNFAPSPCVGPGAGIYPVAPTHVAPPPSSARMPSNSSHSFTAAALDRRASEGSVSYDHLTANVQSQLPPSPASLPLSPLKSPAPQQPTSMAVPSPATLAVSGAVSCEHGSASAGSAAGDFPGAGVSGLPPSQQLARLHAEVAALRQEAEAREFVVADLRRQVADLHLPAPYFNNSWPACLMMPCRSGPAVPGGRPVAAQAGGRGAAPPAGAP